MVAAHAVKERAWELTLFTLQHAPSTECAVAT